MGRASVPTPALYPAFFFVLEKAAKSAGYAVISTLLMHRSHGLQGSLKRRYKHPSPTSINGYHTAKKFLSQSPAKRPTFAFAGESGYTLAFANRIAHSGLHAETGAFTFVQSCRAFDRPSSGKRTAGGSGCTPMACVRFLRHHSPAGLRNILFDLPMLYFSRSAHGDFCVCEARGVSPLSACSTCRRNARCPLVKGNRQS